MALLAKSRLIERKGRPERREEIESMHASLRWKTTFNGFMTALLMEMDAGWDDDELSACLPSCMLSDLMKCQQARA